MGKTSSNSPTPTKLHNSVGSLFGSKFAQSPKKNIAPIKPQKPVRVENPESEKDALWVDKYSPKC